MSEISYELRPTKALVRSILVDTLSRLAPIAPLVNYQYVGFGAVEFLDFDLVHRRLGIHRLTSIESEANVIPRCRFNRPFKGITVLSGTSLTMLPTIDWSGLSIVWLDYTSCLTESVISDINYLARVLIPGSILAITLNAHPVKLPKRRDELESLVGPERIPAGVTNNTLGDWGLAETQAVIVKAELATTFSERGDSTHFRDLLNIHYRDSARMQLLAGIVGAPASDRLIDLCQFDEVPEVRLDGSAIHVRVPLLTRKERAWLNERLPVPSGGSLPRLPGVSAEAHNDYTAVYRRLTEAQAGAS